MLTLRQNTPIEETDYVSLKSLLKDYGSFRNKITALIKSNSSSASKISSLLSERIKSIDFNEARKDVLPFLKDPISADIWSQEFFTKLIERIQCI